MSRLRVQLIAAALFALAWTQSSRLEPQHQSGLLPIDPPTPYIRYLPGDSSRGRVLVIHGLDVSKEVTAILSAALADGGFEVYNIDLPGHGDSPVKFQTDLAQQAIRNAKTYLGDKTIVVGHSLGAGLLLDLAATEHFSTIVLLSPPPLAISEIHADRVLIATGDIDLPPIRSFVPIAADIGNPNVETWILPWAAHSAPIFNPIYIRRTVEWLGGDGERIQTVPRMFWIVVMFVAAVGLGVTLMPGRGLEREAIPIPPLFVRYAAACAIALGVLKFLSPLAWLRFFATDYLISFLLVSGSLLVLTWAFGPALSRRERAERRAKREPDRAKPQERRSGEGPQAAYIRATIAAAFVIAVPGLFVTSHVLHMGLSNGRWWRFPFIVLAGIPLFISDELTIRLIHPRWKSIAVAIITRGLFLAFLLTGVLVFNRESAFLVLIAPLITVFWVALWFAAGVVHRNTQDPLAAALFAAVVQGWAFAAWFVIV